MLGFLGTCGNNNFFSYRLFISNIHLFLVNRPGLNTSTTAPGEKRIYEGSTLAPNFPKVNIVKSKDAKGPFSFNDVPLIRYQLVSSFINCFLVLNSHSSCSLCLTVSRREMKRNLTNQRRFEEDRNRTINDYYRMHLDQTAEKEKMIEAYHAYLESTPGSKKALEELLNNNKSVKIELIPIDGNGGKAATKAPTTDTNSANVTPRTPTSDGGCKQSEGDKSLAGSNKMPVASNA